MPFISRLLAKVIVIGFLVVLPQLAAAQTKYIYTYTGNPFNTFTESAAPGSFDSSHFVSVTFINDAPLPPNTSIGIPLAGSSVSNGRCTIFGFQSFFGSGLGSVSTDASGNIKGWSVNSNRFTGVFPGCRVLSTGAADEGRISSTAYVTSGDIDEGRIDNNPGVWSVRSEVLRINWASSSNRGIITASSIYNDSYLPAGANDGDRRGLGWGINGGWNDSTLDSYPDWLEVAIPFSTKSIQEIDVFTVQDDYASPVEPTPTTTFSQYGLTDFQVQYWTGSVWLDVPGGVVTGNDLVWRKFTFSPIAMSKIRVLVNGASNGYSRITEVEAYDTSVEGNNLPTVALVNQATYESIFSYGAAPASVSLSASAYDSDGSISKVEFFVGETRIAMSQSLTNPYTATWNNVLPGIYEIFAVATDNNGATTWSYPGYILVYDDNQTNVALASNGATAIASSTFSSSYPPTGVIDGNTGAVAWGSGGGWKDATAGAFPDWVEIDFGGLKTIQEIAVQTLQDNYESPNPFIRTFQTFSLYGLTDFQVQYWSGSQWLNVPGGLITGNNFIRREIRFSSISTSKIRVVVNGALGGYSNIAEIEAWTFPLSDTEYSASARLTSPANNQTFIGPATIALTAVGYTQDYPEYPKIEFYAGTTLIATSYGPKGIHTATWSNVQPGNYAITAVGTDYKGQKARSQAVNIIVTGTVLTNVALASNGGLAVSSSTYNNITHSPSSAINGDRKGLSWGAGGGWNDATLEYPDWLEVFFDGTKSIQEIDVFTLQDNYTSPVEPTPTTTFTQYGLTDFQVQYWTGSQWLNVPGGVVTGNNLVWRKFTFSPVSTPRIRVLVNGALNGYSRIVEVEAYGTTDTTNNSPTVTLGSPANSASFSPRATIRLIATANDTDGNISKVDFYLGTTLLASSTTVSSQYLADWQKVPPGNYVITAVATDNLGATAKSLPANITVTSDGIPNPALLVNAGQLIGATGVMVDGILYDVDFIDGTCAFAYSVCDAPHFAFADETSARHAATGLFNLVLVDGVLGQFDSVPGLTYGCTVPSACIIYIPYGNNSLGSGLVLAKSEVHNPDGTGADSILSSTPPDQNFSSTFDSSTNPTAVWALWRYSAPVNLASASNGAVATASSTYSSSYSPSGVINGDRRGLSWETGGGWNDGTADSFSDWLQIDFITMQTIREIDVFTLQDNYSSPIEPTSSTTFSQYGLRDFQVQYWTGAQWLDVPGGVVTGNNLVWRKFTFNPIPTLRIRVLVNGALNGYSRITEVEVYGTTATTNNSPTVVLESPANNASFNAPASVSLSATATDSDGAISKVEFYSGTTLIATSAGTANPYTATWSNVPGGSYVITAVATDNLGATTTSAPANIAVAMAGALTNLALGTNGGVVIASSTYSNSYSPVGAINGDRKGLSWGAGGGWNDGTSDAFPDWLEVDFNGTKSIQEIDVFTLQDNYTSPIEPTSTTTFTQYGLSDFQVQYWTGSQWLNVPGGVVTGNNLVWRKFAFSPISTLKIRVLIDGASNSYSRITEIEAYGVAASGNMAPTSVLNAPSNNATFAAPATVVLNATANDSDGNINKVEFYAGTTLVATSASVANPYTATWSNVSAGSYAITAVATDNLGAATTSAIANITVTGTTPINVALSFNGGVAVASSSYSSAYPAGSTNDGDRKGVSWGTVGGWNDGTLDVYPDWLEIAFDGTKTIQEISVFTVQDNYSSPVDPTPTTTFSEYGLTDFQVQYWTGTQWLDVPGGVVTGNNLVWRKFIFNPISTSKIRVLVNGALNSYSRITEVEAFGTP